MPIPLSGRDLGERRAGLTPVDRDIADVVRHVALVHGTSPDAVWCLDPELRVRYANAVAARSLHRPVEQMLGSRCHELVGSPDAPCPGCRIAEAQETGEVRHATKHEVDARGREVWLEQYWYPIGKGLVLEVARNVTALVKAEREIEHRMRAEERLRSERNRAQTYLDVAEAILLTLDRDGVLTSINRKGTEILGRDAQAMLGHDWFAEFVPSSDRERVVECFRHSIGHDGDSPVGACDGAFVNAVLLSDGSQRTIEWRNALLHDGEGAVAGMLSSGIDVTGRMATEEALRFRSFVLDQATDSIIVHRLDGTVIYANERAFATRGFTEDEFLSLAGFGWVAPAARAGNAKVVDLLRETGQTIFESADATADGRSIPVEVHACTVTVGGELVVVSAGRDISERLEAQETISRMAFYDSLTGLANRALFFDRLEHAIATAARDDSQLAVIFLDLDHFKGVNDTLGHHTGDLLLTAVAERLSAHLRDGDTMARIGGDEFTVLLEHVNEREEVERVVTKLLGCFREPFSDIGGQELFVTASMGIVVTRGAEQTAETLIAQADTAMYTAKESGRNAYNFYVSHMSDAARRRFDLKNDLRHALADGQLAMHYQPQVRVEGGRLVGVEALLRWAHPKHGPVAPSVFLPLAEESGQIFAIGEWTLRQACAEARRWHQAGQPDLRVAVNLSARQFEDPRLVATVAGVLAQSGIEPSNLELEITETIATRDTDRMRETFEDLRALGVRIAVDDFGTGFSSLDQLMRLDVDTLKIDRRFTRDLDRNERAAAITSAVIFLAHKLGLNVVAEGVETPAHYAMLMRQGCDEMQGFLVGRPMSVLEFDMLLARLRGRPVALPHLEALRP
jgi:diguanylate cyclase (GGDEF)-like protein/PAS domain S-box-containing protein